MNASLTMKLDADRCREQAEHTTTAAERAALLRKAARRYAAAGYPARVARCEREARCHEGR